MVLQLHPRARGIEDAQSSGKLLETNGFLSTYCVPALMGDYTARGTVCALKGSQHSTVTTEGYSVITLNVSVLVI